MRMISSAPPIPVDVPFIRPAPRRLRRRERRIVQDGAHISDAFGTRAASRTFERRMLTRLSHHG